MAPRPLHLPVHLYAIEHTTHTCSVGTRLPSPTHKTCLPRANLLFGDNFHAHRAFTEEYPHIRRNLPPIVSTPSQSSSAHQLLTQRKVHILQTLRRRALQQVIYRHIDHNPLSAGVDAEASDLDSVLAGDVLDGRRLADDFDELLAGEAVGVDITDVTGFHFAVEGEVDGVLNIC